jgi:RNA polymerase sigma-70 factor (ECF subfamily)
MTESDISKQLISDYYRSHISDIRAFVAKRIGYSMEESEDIVQNVFLRLLQSDKLISQVTLPCLVYTVARNLVVDHWRRRALQAEYEHYLKKWSGGACNSVGEESVYSAVEVNEVLERGIARLADKQRRIYCMNVIDGLKVSEISLQLNENYKSVENRLGAARKEMRRYVRRMFA